MANRDLPLDGKLVVITGASRGIGRAIAERLAAAGAEIVAAARTLKADGDRGSAEETAALIRSRGGKASAMPVDMEDGASRAALIKPGLKAELTLPEAPGKTHAAVVVGSAESIDRSSRTLRVQLEADNAHGELIAGSYVDAHFALPGAPGVLELPVTALMFRQHGLQVATLSANNTVALKSVQLGRDFGTRAEVVAGIGANDRVIDSPPDWLRDGDNVQPAAAAPGKTAPARSSGQ